MKTRVIVSGIGLLALFASVAIAAPARKVVPRSKPAPAKAEPRLTKNQMIQKLADFKYDSLIYPKIESTAKGMVARDPRIPADKRPPKSNELADALIKSVDKAPFYNKIVLYLYNNLSEDELRTALAFYETSARKKLDDMELRGLPKYGEEIFLAVQSNFEKVTHLPFMPTQPPLPGVPKQAPSNAPTK